MVAVVSALAGLLFCYDAFTKHQLAGDVRLAHVAESDEETDALIDDLIEKRNVSTAVGLTLLLIGAAAFAFGVRRRSPPQAAASSGPPAPGRAPERR